MSDAVGRQRGSMATPCRGFHPHLAWGPVHRASFGLIYGSILVLSLLMAMDEVRDGPVEAALVLLGSVLAVTLTKIFAEILSHSMETGERILTRKAFGAAWSNSHSTLLVANGPTVMFVASGFGWLDVAWATAIAQLFCVLEPHSGRLAWTVAAFLPARRNYSGNDGTVAHRASARPVNREGVWRC